MGNPLLEAWSAGDVVVGLWCTSRDSLVAEALAATGADYVCVDTQHGASHQGNLIEMLQGVQAVGSAPLVRVADNSPSLVGKSLDAGAAGVIIPLVGSGEEARRAVGACRFPPRGGRSFGPFRAAIGPDARGLADLEHVSCIAMIETVNGLKNVEEIAKTDGIDALYVGPSDLSVSLGLPPGSLDDRKFTEALATVRGACLRAGIVAGIHTYNGNTAARFIEEGFRMVTIGVDLRLLRTAASGCLEKALAGRKG